MPSMASSDRYVAIGPPTTAWGVPKEMTSGDGEVAPGGVTPAGTGTLASLVASQPNISRAVVLDDVPAAVGCVLTDNTADASPSALRRGAGWA